MYIIEVVYEGLATKSQSFILGELEKMNISLRIGEKYMNENHKSLKVKLIKILDNF